MKYLSLVSAILLAIGCLPLPIGYYTFLRIAIFISCIILIYADWQKGLNWSNISLGIIGIVLNPVIPIYLHDKAVWIVIDAIAAVIFTAKTFQLFKTN